MECPLKNKDCIKHTPASHIPSCGKSGSLACKDVLHNRLCWTKEENELLIKVLEQYETNQDKNQN